MAIYLLSFRNLLQLALQVGLLSLLAIGAQWLVTRLALPLPSGVIGLAALLTLLALNWLPERFVARGAAWLLGELLLFFIPPVVASIHYAPLLEQYGVSLLCTLVLGSGCVLLFTGLVIDRVFKYERRLRRPIADSTKGA
ncbi:CidA/LrgA family protein [Shewanella marisflavi]|uniref:Murein hydrolase transporter LrgA n=1 Tax=Shewanella marisflavi TaxID=260364 RepID=A0AAC9U2W3_9GAMM|nr:CidA/LrgA family protein [Shewanella marisflavi]ASJ97857.1 murein hydrolase transporter LrgA [Shewanella marisflavi]MCL1040341.1 CidA/LrgA family protein [Shewanella marisflavi]